jgi:hypothetical protein
LPLHQHFSACKNDFFAMALHGDPEHRMFAIDLKQHMSAFITPTLTKISHAANGRLPAHSAPEPLQEPDQLTARQARQADPENVRAWRDD